MRCNLTEAEQKAVLAVPFRCTGEEQEFIERCFIGYLFFEHEADENGRLGVTTECTRCGRKVWWTEREWKRFKQENDVKARSNLLCPDCGCGVTLYPRGRLRNGKALDEYRQVVLLRAIDGALRAVTLGVWKHHGRWESDDAECCVKAAYYFAQGKCQKWRREWAWSEEEQRYTPRLVAQKTMTEPFAKCDSWICRRIGDYAIHGVDQIAASPLRYCAAEQFFKLDGDDPRENTEGLLTYLGLWTHYPRIEQLAKAGCEKIINDAIQGSMNSRALNWRAKTMPAFFGVDKPTVKRLLARGIGQKELEALEQELKILLLPRDPNDDKSVIMEIRGGVGGEESALFANSLMRMYTMYAQNRGWTLELLNLNATELGGVKEAIFSVDGAGAYNLSLIHI